MGFAFESGIPYSDGIVKNRYVGRTFIQPTQAMRQLGIRLKLNPLPSVIRGKRLVVIDDSIVRGNTSKKLIEMLRDAGATEVHMRIVSPEVMWPCFYGIDTDTRDQLIAANMTNDEMCEWMGADSLAFISLQGLRDSLPDVRTPGYCEACVLGRVPRGHPAYTARNSFMTKADFAAAYEKEAQEAGEHPSQRLATANTPDSSGRIVKCPELGCLPPCERGTEVRSLFAVCGPWFARNWTDKGTSPSVRVLKVNGAERWPQGRSGPAYQIRSIQ